MAQKLEIGSVVKLKSGGPAMTVIEPNGGSIAVDTVRLMWFDESGVLSNAYMPAQALEELPECLARKN